MAQTICTMVGYTLDHKILSRAGCAGQKAKGQTTDGNVSKHEIWKWIVCITGTTFGVGTTFNLVNGKILRVAG